MKTPVWLLLLLLGFTAWAQENEEEEEKIEGTNIVVEQVVTASRKPEKRLEAPSTIEVVNADDLLTAPATAFSGALAQVKGLDFANGGINLQKISTRGFSSSFNSRMLQLIDGRLATLPGAGLPQGGLSATSPMDIKTMELILGPAGALYGSNTTAGVLNVITKTPWDEEGLSVSLKGGEQNLIDGNLRYAQIFNDNRFGFKVTGQYLDADEFASDNIFDVAGQNQTFYGSREAAEAAVAAGLAFNEEDLVDEFTVTSEKFELTGYYQGDYLNVTLNYGWSENDGFGVTNLGRNRIEGWEIETVQLRASAEHWFFQATKTDESAGDTYSIQNVPGGLALGLSLDAAQEAAVFINESELLDYEFQANYTFNNLEVIGGVAYREYDPSSAGSFLDDIPTVNGTLNDISRDETGFYLQLDYRALDDKLRLVAAGRHDDFSEFDSQFSPKFGITYNEGNHNFRANFITSYRAPEIIETHLFFFGGIARGNLNGFNIISPEDGSVISQIPALEPEEVETFEIGYRGVFGANWFMEFIGYRSDYDNFISPLTLVSNGVTSFTQFPENDPINPGGVAPAFFTYLNYGEAEIEGADFGVDWYSDNVSVKGSIGYSHLKSFDNTTTIPDLPFNTPEWKYKLQGEIRDIWTEGTFVNAGGRRVNAYDYVSGRWNARLAETFIIDAAVGYIWAEQEATFKLSWSNVTNQEKTELLGTPAIRQFVTFEVSKRF